MACVISFAACGEAGEDSDPGGAGGRGVEDGGGPEGGGGVEGDGGGGRGVEGGTGGAAEGGAAEGGAAEGGAAEGGAAGGGSTDEGAGSPPGDVAPAAVPAVPAEVQAIFDASCADARCHGRTTRPLLADAEESFESLVGTPSRRCRGLTLVAPGLPGESCIVLLVTGQVAGSFMPVFGEPLTDGQVATLTRWIAGLAKDPS